MKKREKIMKTMKFRKLENPMETVTVNGVEITPDEIFEVYDHSIDIIDPDEPDIPGPPYDSYGYNDGEVEYLEMKAELHYGI
jgi:hypothetical protein